jgi:hypothetical protein
MKNGLGHLPQHGPGDRAAVRQIDDPCNSTHALESFRFCIAACGVTLVGESNRSAAGGNPDTSRQLRITHPGCFYTDTPIPLHLIPGGATRGLALKAIRQHLKLMGEFVQG